jgi:hypothetical protein
MRLLIKKKLYSSAEPRSADILPSGVSRGTSPLAGNGSGRSVAVSGPVVGAKRPNERCYLDD